MSPRALAFLDRLRLRHKLALSLSIAAILPVIVAAGVAVRVVLEGLEDGVREQTTKQVRVGVNLVLRNVERLGADAVRLSSTPGLEQAILAGPGAVGEFIASEDPHLPSALIHVTDARGRVVATRAVGGNLARYESLGIRFDPNMAERGLRFERRVTIAALGDVLVVRAVAPVVDSSFALRGTVVMSLPLDGDFADQLKGALGNDVLLHAGGGPARSSFVDGAGGRVPGIAPAPGVAGLVLTGGSQQARATIRGREFTLGYAPLKNLDGEHVGMLAVAVPRDALARAKQAAGSSLALGVAGAFLFALGLAALLSRRLTRPLVRLHAGALAVARGDLDVKLGVPARGAKDELDDLSAAFSTMTGSLRENRERLAARMREIVGLHEAGRAVSSVLGLDEVLRKVVDSVARVLDTRLAALWLMDDALLSDPGVTGSQRVVRRELRIAAARTKPLLPLGDPITTRKTMVGEVAEMAAEALTTFAEDVARTRNPVRIDKLTDESRWQDAALRAQVDGSILAVPLEQKGQVIGVLVVGRVASAPQFTDADENLLATFADQAATAIENSRLYEEVRAFSGELEEKVKLRTRELTSMNMELGRAIAELRETQAQLVLSERMAGLGALVAGVAHEINSPSAAVRGSVDALSENVRRLARRERDLGELGLSEGERGEFLNVVEALAAAAADKRVASPAEVRRRARDMAGRLVTLGVPAGDVAARVLAELGAPADPSEPGDHSELVQFLVRRPGVAETEILVGYLQEYAYLYRNVSAIQTAIKQIQRIVGALKGYSHLDQAKIEPVDLHEGIENTLVILHHELKYGILIQRKYGELPRVPVFVDELNQVWTNIIHNAVQALKGKGEIVIETLPPGVGEHQQSDAVTIRVIDNGPGIPRDVLPRIFEPFFTTKVKGEGTGLGLGIVKKIVDKHGGRVDVDSAPGRTCFTIVLPTMGSLQAGGSPDDSGESGDRGSDGSVRAASGGAS